eukprot:7873588-Prorocentrum_lima.AAC.1
MCIRDRGRESRRHGEPQSQGGAGQPAETSKTGDSAGPKPEDGKGTGAGPGPGEAKTPLHKEDARR